MSRTSRTTFIATLGAVAARLTAPASAEPAKALRIGYQKDGVLLIVKQQGILAQRLAETGATLSWVEFQSGPPLLEALNAGSVDIGQTGDTPPIFAQAAGTRLLYLAAAPDAGRRSGIVVHAGSGIDGIAGLKGKRVAFTRGSSAHNFVVHALATVGLTYADVTAVNLQPADAAAAFRNGSVDAWGIWDPFFALAQRFPDTRTLVTADKIFPTNRFFLAGRDFVAQNVDLATAFVDEIDRASRWARTHPADLAQLFAAQTGVDPDVEKIVAGRDVYAVRYLDEAIVRQQQAIADTFLQLGLIPHALDVRAIAYVPSPKAKAELARGAGA